MTVSCTSCSTCTLYIHTDNKIIRDDNHIICFARRRRCDDAHSNVLHGPHGHGQVYRESLGRAAPPRARPAAGARACPACAAPAGVPRKLCLIVRDSSGPSRAPAIYYYGLRFIASSMRHHNIYTPSPSVVVARRRAAPLV